MNINYGRQFYKTLLDTYKAFFEDDKNIDIYKNSKAWTAVVSKEADSLIDKTLKTMFESCVSSNEYYHIDNLVYFQLNKCLNSKMKGMNYRAWELIAAVEHENDYRDWTDELVKLSFINCRLRVVIGYGDYDKGDPYADQLLVANEIATVCNFKDYIHEDKQEYILIFGPRNNGIEGSKDILSKTEAFEWKHGSFKRLR